MEKGRGRGELGKWKREEGRGRRENGKGRTEDGRGRREEGRGRKEEGGQNGGKNRNLRREKKSKGKSLINLSLCHIYSLTVS